METSIIRLLALYFHLSILGLGASILQPTMAQVPADSEIQEDQGKKEAELDPDIVVGYEKIIAGISFHVGEGTAVDNKGRIIRSVPNLMLELDGQALGIQKYLSVGLARDLLIALLREVRETDPQTFLKLKESGLDLEKSSFYARANKDDLANQQRFDFGFELRLKDQSTLYYLTLLDLVSMNSWYAVTPEHVSGNNFPFPEELHRKILIPAKFDALLIHEGNVYQQIQEDHFSEVWREDRFKVERREEISKSPAILTRINFESFGFQQNYKDEEKGYGFSIHALEPLEVTSRLRLGDGKIVEVQAPIFYGNLPKQSPEWGDEAQLL